MRDMRQLLLRQLLWGIGDMKNTQKTALGGLTAALVSVIMLVSDFTYPNQQFSIAAAAGVIILSLSFAAGKRTAIYSYAASSVIIFLICTYKLCAVYYILFFGYYPLLRSAFGRISSRVLSFAAKLIYFNLTVFVIIALCRYMLQTDMIVSELFGISIPYLFAMAINAAFIVYDLALHFYTVKYESRIAKLSLRYFK